MTSVYKSKQERDNFVIETYKQGFSVNDTAELSRVSSSTVGDIIKRNGLSRDPGKAIKNGMKKKAKLNSYLDIAEMKEFSHFLNGMNLIHKIKKTDSKAGTQKR